MSPTLRPPRTLRPYELIVPALATSAASVLPFLVWSRLPDPVAIHWGLDGRPDGSAPLVIDAVLLAVATALVAFLPLVAVGRADRRTARTMLAVSYGMAAFFVLLRWRTLALNVDAIAWTEAGSLTLFDLVLLLLLATPVAWLGFWLGGRRPESARPLLAVRPQAMPPDGRLLWVGHQAWSGARLLGPGLIVAGATVSALRVVIEALILGGALILVGLLLWWFTSITVAVGPVGLRVRFGPLGWPSIRVPLASVERIGIEEVEPLAFGGWGYRVMPGVRAVVIRRGIGLRIGRIGRPDLVVTVDDAATAAGVLAAHLERHRSGERAAGERP